MNNLIILEETNDQALTLALTGSFDSLSSPVLQERIITALDEYRQVILDFSQVDYISSAGLRVLLMAQKTAKSTQKRFTIQNVREVVLDILDQTGFSDIIERI